jgi:hypothetical protein
MTYHFAAILPDLGVGMLSDSVVSEQLADGTWSQSDRQPKTFILSTNAALACAGDAEMCLQVVKRTAARIGPDATFAEVAPNVQRAYVEAAERLGLQQVEFLLAARTEGRRSKHKLIKFVMKASGEGLERVEPLDQHHYTAGLDLPALTGELCIQLTETYPHAGRMQELHGAEICANSQAVKSPNSLGIGMCFGAMMPIVEQFIRSQQQGAVMGSPWTILLMPEDGPIHFQSSEMYDGSKSVQPGDI